MPELSEKGLRLFRVLVSQIEAGRFSAHDPKTFLGYGQTLDLLNLPPDATRGPTDGKTLQLNGLNDLARWIREHPNRLPRLTGLIVSKTKYDEEDGGYRMPDVPGKGYFREYKRDVEDWTWWLKESEKSLAFDWSPYLPAEEMFDLEDIEHVGFLSEGAEREATGKVRRRSQKLRELAREHFRGLSRDRKLHCAVCDWTTPAFLLGREIIEIHHELAIRSAPKEGRKLTLKEALSIVFPLCPRCHRMLGAKPGGGSFTVPELQAKFEES